MITIPLYGAVKELYENLEKQCSLGCGAVLRLRDVALHEISCGKPKCENYDMCRSTISGVIGGFKCCSEKCAIYLSVRDKKQLDKEELSLLLMGMTMRMNFVNKKIHSFCYWDTVDLDPCIEVSADMKTAKNTSKTKCYKNVVSKVGFCSGVTVIEMEFSSRQERYLKIGVVRGIEYPKTRAFSDAPTGYAYFTMGQLRHGDHAKGEH